MTKPRRVVTVPGMGGRVFDYRGTGLCPPNGGRIRPLIMVEHIPVMHNRPGTDDLEALGRVLKQQGLAVQFATDREGNVAIYTRADELCYHARGANAISCGVEHMHYGVSEPWSERQCRAAAWLYVRVKRNYGIPYQAGRLAGDGYGRVKVVRRGHVSHRGVSAKAGYNDRSDPGPAYPWAHIRRLAAFYERRGSFRGAPKRD